MSQCTVCQRPDRAAIDAALRQQTPGRNAVARQFGIPRTTLRRHAHHAQTPAREEPMMDANSMQQAQEVEAGPAPVAAGEAEVARLQEALTTQAQTHQQEREALCRQVQGVVKELREVRQIVACIPLHRTELPTMVARLQARVASQERALQAVEEQLHSLVAVLDGKMVTVMRLEELFARLRTDAQLWAACLNIARHGSQGTHSSTLKEWLATVAGRTLSDNDKVLQ